MSCYPTDTHCELGTDSPQQRCLHEGKVQVVPEAKSPTVLLRVLGCQGELIIWLSTSTHLSRRALMIALSTSIFLFWISQFLYGIVWGDKKKTQPHFVSGSHRRGRHPNTTCQTWSSLTFFRAPHPSSGRHGPRRCLWAWTQTGQLSGRGTRRRSGRRVREEVRTKGEDDRLLLKSRRKPRRKCEFKVPLILVLTSIKHTKEKK